MERFILLCTFFISGYFSEVKDNETLIYHWDVNHKMNYYCQFGTDEEIRESTEIQCFRRNKGMQYILPDGVITYPYLAYGSAVGFVLKCGDIPNGDLYKCSRNVYTSCRYTCKTSSVTKVVRCELTGPRDNVTAQWSITEPCPEPSSAQSVSQDVQDVQITPGTSAEPYVILGASTAKIVTGNVTIKADFDLVTDSSTTNTTDVTILRADDTLIIASVVIIGCILTLALLFGLLFLWMQKRKRELRCKFNVKIVPQESKGFYHNVAVRYSDNPQELPDEIDTSHSEESSIVSGVSHTTLVDPDLIKLQEMLGECESLRSNFSTLNIPKELIEEENGFLTTAKNQQKDEIFAGSLTSVG